MKVVHVSPTDNLFEHEMREDCPCGPQVSFEDGGKLVVHASLDGRELQEQG